MALEKQKELSFTAVVLGVLLAVVFGAANAYLGLRVGLTVSASVPAARSPSPVLRGNMQKTRCRFCTYCIYSRRRI